MDAKENLLRAIHYDNPAYVPRSDEALFAGLQLKGNFRHGNWVDAWGVRWEATLAQFVPFPKGNPLPSLDLLDAYRLPDPAALLADDECWRPCGAAIADVSLSPATSPTCSLSAPGR